MTTIKNLVKQVLMSTVAVGLFTMSFTACSDDVEFLESGAAASDTETAVSQDGNPIQPIGLVYKDFITPNDVQILNADTTEIAVSKALADKLGIKDFVQRPMGIWQSFEEIAYLRRAYEQKLVGDKYILKVVRAGVAEVLACQNVELNTSIYVNPNAGKTRGGECNKYTDSRNVIHPIAVAVQSLPGEEGATTRSGGPAHYGVLTAEQILNGETFNIPHTRGLDDVVNFLIRFIGSGGHATCDDHGSVANINGILTPKPIKVKVGDGKNDTLVINSRIPYDISLDYTLKLDAQFKMKTGLDFLVGLLDPFELFSVDTKLFESRLDGAIDVKPEVSIGIGGKAEIPKEYQRVKIASLGNYIFHFQVGPVPIPVVLQPALYIQLDAKVDARIYTGVQLEYKSSFFADVKYQKGSGWDVAADYNTNKCEFSFLPPRGTINAKTGVGAMLGLDVMVGGVAGPSFSVGPMVTANLNLRIAPWDKDPFLLDANLKRGVHGRAGAKLKLWTIELAEWSTDIVFGPEEVLWEYHFDGKKALSEGGSSLLLGLVDKMRQDAEAQKVQYEADQVAKDAENQKNWNEFVAYMNFDDDILALKAELNGNQYLFNQAVQNAYDEVMKNRLCTNDFTLLKFVLTTKLRNIINSLN